MEPFDLIAVLLVLAAGFSYLNHRLLKLPTTIGLMALTLGTSALVLIGGEFYPEAEAHAEEFVRALDFDQALLHGMLGYLLFAGGLHFNIQDLARRKLVVSLLATLSVLISTAVVGGLAWAVVTLLGLPVRLIYCLLFGALISPTDPIAVLGILKRIGVPRALETDIAGEALLNDGAAVVAFLGFLEIATGERGFDPGHLSFLFLREGIGGAVFGLGIGYGVYRLLQAVDSYHVEILLSLALVAGGYALADALGLSAPIAMVTAGLLLGNSGRGLVLSPARSERLHHFWGLVDEVLNAMLFVLLGLEVLVLTFTGKYLAAGLLAIPVVLLARLASVALPVAALRRWHAFEPATVRVLTWGGLRGGVSVAMALSLPAQVGSTLVPDREVVLVMTYIVVVFSILVQGLTLGPLASRWLAGTSQPAEAALPAGVPAAEQPAHARAA